ncbi:hypothetical protein [Erwinia sp. OLFS4]|uniref:hypothetical protein n=1 Tax=Erwinia sp. OLFS4 TaxID=1912858 RepID=UPI001F53D648|nr:hypothetical protein [Erwinia sp. OLFS4]
MMKIKMQLSAAVLVLAAGKAGAFQARVSMPEGNNASQRLAAFKIVLADGRSFQIGVCDAHSVNGCNCPFCTQLRNAGR